MKIIKKKKRKKIRRFKWAFWTCHGFSLAMIRHCSSLPSPHNLWVTSLITWSSHFLKVSCYMPGIV